MSFCVEMFRSSIHRVAENLLSLIDTHYSLLPHSDTMPIQRLRLNLTLLLRVS